MQGGRWTPSNDEFDESLPDYNDSLPHRRERNLMERVDNNSSIPRILGYSPKRNRKRSNPFRLKYSTTFRSISGRITFPSASFRIRGSLETSSSQIWKLLDLALIWELKPFSDSNKKLITVFTQWNHAISGIKIQKNKNKHFILNLVTDEIKTKCKIFIHVGTQLGLFDEKNGIND